MNSTISIFLLLLFNFYLTSPIKIIKPYLQGSPGQEAEYNAHSILVVYKTQNKHTCGQVSGWIHKNVNNKSHFR